MGHSINVIILAIISFAIELLYIQIAKKYDIVDRPNERSAHNKITIRGLGIGIAIQAIGFCIFKGLTLLYFTAGLFLISGVSFWDDIRSISKRLRFFVHVLAILFLIFQIYQDQFLSPVLFPLVLFGVGVINAVNFMDGINGITGLYGLVCLFSLFLINQNTQFTDTTFFQVLIIAVLVFLFFNFRKQAIGFAGDVGSVGLAFILLFLLLSLIQASGNWKYIFLLAFYGVDTGYTILYRLTIGEKIFEAHKLHFFQILVHQFGWPHLRVSALYGLTQSLLNIWILNFELIDWWFYLPFLVLSLLIHFIRKSRGLSIITFKPNNKI